MEFMYSMLLRGLAALCLLTLPAAAAIIFSDGFEGNTPQLNSAPAGWTVSNGTVDILGTGVFGHLCLNGTQCIDMDGSTWNAGDLSRGFTAINGFVYTLSWDMHGNRRGGSDTMTVSVGGTSQSYTLGAWDAGGTFSLAWIANVGGLQNVTFSHAGGDNIGILIDNVRLTGVPEPATIGLTAAGLLALLAFRRRTMRPARD
jgi:hypothetical protein